MKRQSLVKGRFITIEGVEGAGKSSLMQYIQGQLKSVHIPCLMTREPGGTAISEAIRTVLLMQQDDVMNADTELLLMFAARAQHVTQVIVPALQRGQWVICDRFTDASFAYQGGGRGILLDRIQSLASWVHGDLQPDITLLLDLPVELGFSRITGHRAKDRIENEGKDFFERVRQHYLLRARKFPQRFQVIDATGDFSSVEAQVMAILKTIMV